MTRTPEPVDRPVTGSSAVHLRDHDVVPDGRNPNDAAGRPGVPGGGRPQVRPRNHGTAPGGKAAPRLQGGRLIALLFLGPALITLVVLVAYPILYTAWLSLRSADGSRFVGLANYTEIFTAAETRKALLNNAIWVVVAPSLVTALGLIFAVLSERIRASTAFKTILFMPMAISFLAAGVTFRLVYDESPDRGALNAVTVAVHDAFAPPSRYYGVRPRDEATLLADGGGYRTAQPVTAGDPVALPLVGLAPERIPSHATTAGRPLAGPGVQGLVWLDFTPGGGGNPGVIDSTERGLPQMSVEALRGSEVVGRTTTDGAGRFAFPSLTSGAYTIRLTAGNFTEPFEGVAWLGPTFVTPAIIGAYIWIWAGFAMVLITAGLSAIPRDALEAARVDGATEWQVLWRVTIPLVRPLLVVVFVTLVINVLKIFDLVLVLAPESSQDDATVVALEMYRVSIGQQNFGLGSALGVLLFLFVLPAMLFNIRRLRRDRA